MSLMIVAFRADRFQDNLFEDEVNAARLVRFVPYTVERRPGPHNPAHPPPPPMSARSSSKFVMLVSSNPSVIDDFNYDDYFPLECERIKSICREEDSCSHVLDYMGAFIMEHEYGYLFLEDLGDAGTEFTNWVQTLMSTTRYVTDNWLIAGRNEAECFQAMRQFSSFCDQFSRMTVAVEKSATQAQAESSKLSYRDALRKPGVVAPIPIPAPDAAPSSSARGSARDHKWVPKVVVTKPAAHVRQDKKYGRQPEDSMPMLTDEGYFIYFFCLFTCV